MMLTWGYFGFGDPGSARGSGFWALVCGLPGHFDSELASADSGLVGAKCGGRGNSPSNNSQRLSASLTDCKTHPSLPSLASLIQQYQQFETIVLMSLQVLTSRGSADRTLPVPPDTGKWKSPSSNPPCNSTDGLSSSSISLHSSSMLCPDISFGSWWSILKYRSRYHCVSTTLKHNSTTLQWTMVLGRLIYSFLSLMSCFIYEVRWKRDHPVIHVCISY